MILRRLTAAFLIAALPGVAFAQSTVLQGGPWTSGHVPMYSGSGGSYPIVQDGGTAGGGAAGVNPSQLGLTGRATGTPPYTASGSGPLGANFCMYDGPTTAAGGYHYLCLDPNVTGGFGALQFNAGGGAAAIDLKFIINGVTYVFPDDFPTIPVTVPNGGTGRTSLTAYNLLVGAGTSSVGLIAPSATSGVALVSQGSSANPAYGTVGIAGGGTGQTSANAALNALLPDQSGQNGKVLATDGTDAAWTSIAGTGTVTSVATGTGLTGGPITTSGTISFASVADGSILANISGGSAAPTANTLSAILDDQIGSGQGTIAMRGAATWGALTPGTTGLPLLSAGPGNDLTFGQLSITNLNIASQAQGDVVYFNGATWTRLGAGTSGYVLQTLGAGANPQWAQAPLLTTVNTFTKAQRGASTNLTDAATIAWDMSLGNNAEVQLGGNRTLGVPTNGGVGQSGSLNVIQDTTGSRTLAYAWPYTFPSGTAPTLTTTALAWDKLSYDVVRYQSSTVTITIATPGVVTWTAHGLKTGDFLQLTTTGALPTGLSASTTYWVSVIDANTFRLATSKANAAAGTYIATSGSQSGVQTATCININMNITKDLR